MLTTLKSKTIVLFQLLYSLLLVLLWCVICNNQQVVINYSRQITRNCFQSLSCRIITSRLCKLLPISITRSHLNTISPSIFGAGVKFKRQFSSITNQIHQKKLCSSYQFGCVYWIDAGLQCCMSGCAPIFSRILVCFCHDMCHDTHRLVNYCRTNTMNHLTKNTKYLLHNSNHSHIVFYI